jgi:hypothetical protein
MQRLHLHLLSDSTGETLDMIAKAALAQFESAEVVRHFWPMVRSQQHLDRIMSEIATNPGLVVFTLVSTEIRERLETRCATLGLRSISALDTVTDALETLLGQTGNRPISSWPGCRAVPRRRPRSILPTGDIVWRIFRLSWKARRRPRCLPCAGRWWSG